MDTTDMALKLAAVNAKLDRLLEAVARLEARMDAAEKPNATQQLESRTGLGWKREAHGRWCTCKTSPQDVFYTTNPKCPIHGIKDGG